MIIALLRFQSSSDTVPSNGRPVVLIPTAVRMSRPPQHVCVSLVIHTQVQLGARTRLCVEKTGEPCLFHVEDKYYQRQVPDGTTSSTQIYHVLDLSFL